MYASSRAIVVKWQRINIKCIMMKRMKLGVLQNRIDWWVKSGEKLVPVSALTHLYHAFCLAGSYPCLTHRCIDLYPFGTPLVSLGCLFGASPCLTYSLCAHTQRAWV